MNEQTNGVIIIIVCLFSLYFVVDFLSSFNPSPASETQLFVAVSGVPKALSYGIASVGSLSILTANTSTNSSIVPGNATLTIVGSPASAASLEVIHDAGDAGRDVFVNGYNVGALTAAASDTFTVSVLYLVAGDNLVDVR